MTVHWTSGNELELLENGDAFFPAVFDAMRGARRSIMVETFIVFDDKVGNALKQILIDAARRGVRVDITVDGYGSTGLPAEFIDSMTAAGVGFHVFDPRPKRLGMRTNLFRRMHRKIVVIDDAQGFIGGINFSADHLIDFGPQAKQDYAISIRGPLVDDLTRLALETLAPTPARLPWRRRRRTRINAAPGDVAAALVVRDNDEHTNDIELHYRMGIRSARHSITIANAYFFPGYRFLRDLRSAARRGVRVRLILQGEPDMWIARFVASMLYDYLLSAGVEIYEYCERPFHGKVATMDGAWSTVGSSNLEPLSLALNLEANVMIHDPRFSSLLQRRLEVLFQHKCRRIQRLTRPRRKIQRVFLSVFVFHFLRRFPAWAGWLPAHEARLMSVPAPAPVEEH